MCIFQKKIMYPLHFPGNCRPCEGGDPWEIDSRLRGNDSSSIVCSGYKIIALLFFLISLFSSFVYANDSSTLLSQYLKNMHSMQASFSQTVLGKNGKSIQRSTGYMYLQRPSQFRWETLRPNKQLVVTNGKHLWIYDPDLDQVTIRSLSRAAGDTPAILLSDKNLMLDKEFVVSKTQGSTEWFTLIPRDRSSMIAKLKLGFANHVIQKMELQDHLSHRTVIDFYHVKLNAPLSSSLFNFQPPSRVDVIDETKR